MNILIIPDKFKGSLTADEVIEAIREGLSRRSESIQTYAITASDGGDGFLDAICKSTPSVRVMDCQTTDPLDRPIEARYGWDEQRESAYVEMARASGMELLSADERDPLLTSTRGTGVLIRDAIARGAREIYVGLGGSATNDGGTGIADALGYRFLDRDGNRLSPVGGSLESIHRIDRSAVAPELSRVQIFAINDVANPLVGAEGAAAVYGPQKGADPAAVRRLDAGLDRLQQVVVEQLHVDAQNVPGAGAAGGTGYGLKVFLGAEFLSGIEFVLSLTGIEPLLESGAIDQIITGEGRIDDQTAYGKLVRGVADIGQKYSVPVSAICGRLDLKQKSIDDLGLRNVMATFDPAKGVEYSMRHAGRLVAEAAERILDR